jgi:hypothetical protein
MRASVDPVENLKIKVRAAVAEYDEAVAYHETWRIASDDAALHKRVGHSFAGNTFLVVRKALRRELLLSLARLWDTQTGTVKMHSIADDLENPAVLNSLWPDTPTYEEPRRMAADAASLIREHEKGGPNYAALDSVRTLRNQHLAHRQTRRVRNKPRSKSRLLLRGLFLSALFRRTNSKRRSSVCIRSPPN